MTTMAATVSRTYTDSLMVLWARLPVYLTLLDEHDLHRKWEESVQSKQVSRFGNAAMTAK